MARTPKRCLAIALNKDWGRSTRRNASLEGVDSSECADMIEGPIHQRVPPARGLCAALGRLSKTAIRELIDSSSPETVLVGFAGCKPAPRSRSDQRRIGIWYEYGHLSVGEQSAFSRKDRRQTLFHLVKPRANSRSALGPTAAKGGRTADRQFASVACLSCRRNAQQLRYLDTAAFRTMWRISLTADQGLECMVTRLTLILINRHGRSDSSIAEARALVSSSQTPSRR